MRIIAGTFKSRTIQAPRGQQTRPTSDRVREALFSILGDLTGMRVLDIYAGSGTLSFEALSRGAAYAVCVDASREATQTIEHNAQNLGVRDRIRVLKTRVQQAGAFLKHEAPFDRIFIDPPYLNVPNNMLSKEFDRLYSDAPQIVYAHSRIICEHATHDKPPVLAQLLFEETRTWGDTSISFYSLNCGNKIV